MARYLIKLNTSRIHFKLPTRPTAKMRFSLFFLSALVASAAAVVIPDHVHEHDFEADVSPAPASILEKRDSYDCKGSSMCSSLQVRACDDAVNNKLIRNDGVNYGAPG